MPWAVEAPSTFGVGRSTDADFAGAEPLKIPTFAGVCGEGTEPALLKAGVCGGGGPLAPVNMAGVWGAGTPLPEPAGVCGAGTVP